TGKLTERFIAAMNEDCEKLGIARPEHEPRATQYVPEIIAMVGELLARDYAYVASNGDVMYAVARFPAYGRLSGKRLQDLRAGARVEVDEAKRDPLDFVLWKRAKPGEPSWESPWGPGRPGWHIERSAMTTALLGTHFDVRGAARAAGGDTGRRRAHRALSRQHGRRFQHARGPRRAADLEPRGELGARCGRYTACGAARGGTEGTRGRRGPARRRACAVVPAREERRRHRSPGSFRRRRSGPVRCRDRSAHRGAHRGPAGQELGGVGSHPRRAGEGRRGARGQAGGQDQLAARLVGWTG